MNDFVSASKAPGSSLSHFQQSGNWPINSSSGMGAGSTENLLNKLTGMSLEESSRSSAALWQPLSPSNPWEFDPPVRPRPSPKDRTYFNGPENGVKEILDDVLNNSPSSRPFVRDTSSNGFSSFMDPQQQFFQHPHQYLQNASPGPDYESPEVTDPAIISASSGHPYDYPPSDSYYSQQHENSSSRVVNLYNRSASPAYIYPPGGDYMQYPAEYPMYDYQQGQPLYPEYAPPPEFSQPPPNFRQQTYRMPQQRSTPTRRPMYTPPPPRMPPPPQFSYPRMPPPKPGLYEQVLHLPTTSIIFELSCFIVSFLVKGILKYFDTYLKLVLAIRQLKHSSMSRRTPTTIFVIV
ncbi:hypothetical protein Ciccas_007248 [Cichlidogyrus casuarinus]|uniref:Uncharacterized protein n=1 Tax=Cichlidogyrus casuarinus TaxID=1844966 RepID=A0ABD2Q446_9PLAT